MVSNTHLTKDGLDLCSNIKFEPDQNLAESHSELLTCNWQFVRLKVTLTLLVILIEPSGVQCRG